MGEDSSIGARVFACLLVVTVLGGGITGVAAGVSSTGPALTSSTVPSTNDSLETDGTTESIRSVLDGTAETLEVTTDAVEDTTDGTTDTVENTTNSTTDELENVTTDADGSDGAIDATVNETAETVDDTVSNGTETVDETGDIVDTTLNETALNASLDAESGTGGRNSSSDRDGASDSEPAAEDASAEGGNGDGSDSSEMPSNTETATDAVLVGMLGAITASGAAAGSAAAGGAGASGAAGSASTATASWLSEFRSAESLRRAGTDLWKLLPLFRYSQYDDSDPLEHDRRRAIYETIEEEPGCYLSQVSDRTEIPLSTVRYHVRILEDEDLVTAIKRNGKRRYFLEETDAELQAALAEPAKRDVLETLADLGQAHNGRLADELERDPSTVSHHLAALEDDGLVVREKDGRSIVNELPPRVEAALIDEPVSDADSRPAPADD